MFKKLLDDYYVHVVYYACVVKQGDIYMKKVIKSLFRFNVLLGILYHPKYAYYISFFLGSRSAMGCACVLRSGRGN